MALNFKKLFIQPTTSEGKHNVIIQCRRRSRFWQRRTKCAASYFQTEIASFIKVALLSSFLLTDWVQEFISRQQFVLALAPKRPSFLKNECAMISIYSAFLCLALTVRYKDVSRFYGNYAFCSSNLAHVKERALVKGRYVPDWGRFKRSCCPKQASIYIISHQVQHRPEWAISLMENHAAWYT